MRLYNIKISLSKLKKFTKDFYYCLQYRMKYMEPYYFLQYIRIGLLYFNLTVCKLSSFYRNA